ncbi:signal transducer and activator of transcription 1-alpha/beta-like isoform X2 [Parambassis ranga]|uniref:Signal transducer and activator of transcription n=1 Tax=Parambassis ranga TaxID=210632 RepID=A0A6P7HGH2_9TELE|nr:signal transducer and activator of transcription 1-alpha/beta-like isoform X2 [Parambassis ranga]
MAQWQELLRLDSALQSRVRQLYEKKFPREIRHHLCMWIESQDWHSAAVDENKAKTCFHAFLLCLEEQWNRSVQENNILQGPDFSGMKDYLVENFQYQPQNLAILLSECLKEEKNILASVTEVQRCGTPGLDQNQRDLHNTVNELTRQTSEVKKEIKQLEGLNEKLDFVQKTWQSKEQHNGLAQSNPVVEEEVLKRLVFITQTTQTVLEQIVNILKQAEQIVVTLTDVELPQWKHRQQMACIGSPVDTSLDHLEKWFTTVAEVLLGVHGELQKLQEQNSKYSSTCASGLAASMGETEKFALSLLMKLVTNALVVEKQPVMHKSQHRPLILKTEVQFKVTVRFLANLPEFKYQLKVKPIFDKDVEEVKTASGFRRFDFNSDDSKVLDVDTPGGGLMAEFGHMSLKEKKSRSKGQCENRLVVTEELHIIKFVIVFQYAGQRCNIEASSLPVLVISSTNQASSAWASIMWWNMQSTMEPWNLSLFSNPPPLPWQQLSKALSWQFLSVGQRELDENQLSMLRDKIVGNCASEGRSDDPDDHVQWSRFSKNESAWMWIDGILDLIKKHMVDIWRDGFIMGFVSKERTRLLLEKKPAGTFLIRFSESIKYGAITFSWVDQNTHIRAVEPYTKKELQGISLPQIIYHYSLTAHGKTRKPLLYLYPDIPKDVAFGRYYKLSEMSSTVDINGYVNRKLVSVSVYPIPPPSPPREQSMEVDTDVETDTDLQQLLDELFADFSRPTCTQGHFLNPLSLQGSYADYPNSF